MRQLLGIDESEGARSATVLLILRQLVVHCQVIDEGRVSGFRIGAARVVSVETSRAEQVVAGVVHSVKVVDEFGVRRSGQVAHAAPVRHFERDVVLLDVLPEPTAKVLVAHKAAVGFHFGNVVRLARALLYHQAI